MSYIVTPAPHKLSKFTTQDWLFYQTLGLVMCVIFGIISYQLNAFIVLVCCLGACAVTEIVCSLIKNKKFIITDYSFLVTGLVLTAIMPANASWYYCIIAGVIAIASKYLFGGLGNNMFNPAALGRATLGCCVAELSSFALEGQTALQLLTSGDKSSLSLANLFLGKIDGALGTTCIVLLLIIGAIYLIFGLIRWENVLFALAGFALYIGIAIGGGDILPYMLSGSFVFVLVFMLSDPVTSPYNQVSRCIYAILFGVISGVFLSKNIMGESGVFLALLLVNFIAPVLDRIMSLFHRGGLKHD